MRTFSSWEPLESPAFSSGVDEIREIAAQLGLSAGEVRDGAMEGGLISLVADSLAVAAKVTASQADEWLCRICGGTSRTCECEA